MRKTKFTKLLLITAFLFTCNILGAQTTEQKYESAIEMGDKYFKNKDYINAKASYNLAIQLDSEKEHPKNKLKETLRLLRAQMEIKSRYAIEVTKADIFFEAKKYSEAINKYNDAQKILPEEKYPQNQINIIKKTIADEIVRKENYQNAIINGDKYYNNNEYEKAQDEYLIAASLDAEAKLPKEKLEEIKKILISNLGKRNEYNIAISNADFFFKKNELQKAIKEYKTASSILPDESFPKEKIVELHKIINSQNNYDDLIETADEYYVVKDFKNAQKIYSEALQQNPGKAYPKDMLEKINKAIANKKTTEEQDYKNAIANGNTYFKEQKFQDAENEFEFALRLKPDEKYPKEKLEEINKVILKIAREEEAHKNYENAITIADEYFNNKKYDEARKSFQNALTFIPEENYPLEKISEINNILSEISNKEAIKKEYENAVAKADEFLKNNKYENAKSKYLDARNIKPSEDYPKQKIDEINKILTEIEAKRSIDDKYNICIAKADEMLNNKDYQNALLEYKKAENLKPSEKYSGKQIIIVNRKLKELEAEKRKVYELFITKANSFFNEEQYTQAKETFQKASKLIPAELYPQEKINECNAVITSLRKEKQQKYDIAIADADKFYNAKIYDQAIVSFQQAFELLPFEKYPAEMIEKINKIMDDNVLVNVNTENIIIKINTKKEFLFDAISVSERKNNYILIKIKNLSGESIKAILSYGSKDSKNGGTLIKIPPSKNIKDYFIRIGVQYKWFSEDNIWISLVPEGGDIEVSLIRISKGD
ncbi:MAG: hypothetical protein K8R41_08765 [Bacteroidales bacterium]|nr:hypothetical protein [Bacteroidales bacterium]